MKGEWKASTSANDEEGDTESIGQKSCSVKILYKREPWPASSSANVEEESRQYSGDIGLSFCIKNGRKHYPHICRNARIRRKQDPSKPSTFGHIIKGSRPTKLSPSVLTGQNYVLERKLSVAKKDAINKHLKKSLMFEARRLIEYLVVEKVKSQPKLPRHPFQVLGDPLLENVEDVSPEVLAAIHFADEQLIAFLRSLFDGQAVYKFRQRYLRKTKQPMRELYNKKHMVTDILSDFCQDDPKLIKILRRIERLYRKWKDQRLEVQ
ncbi:uncharacterized protein LOC110184544 [Drosophila serrata]|uniref:uncharacterized protein LOC110184544 n=1 Tax=Drosophila serrata TaxID=7274 RepID=UPI000A1CF8C2|nr:uncharacterized protein LOC110184544 [Drosophila serrata]